MAGAESEYGDTGGCEEGGRSRLELIEDGICPTCRKEYSSRQGVLKHHTMSHGESAITDEMLLAEIRELADIFGRTPTKRHLDNHGNFSDWLYIDRFGGWNAALEAAGFEPNKFHNVPDEALIDELCRLADELGRLPTMSDIVSDSKFGRSIYQSRFGSWNAALEAAGFELNHPRDFSNEELLGAIRRLADELGRTPSYDDMNDRGEFGTSTYEQYFGCWNAALEAAGFGLNVQQDIPVEDLLREVRGLAEELGRVPRMRDMAEYGDFSPPTYYRHFSSWAGVVTEAGLEPRTHEDWVLSGEDHPFWNGGKPRYYGPNWGQQRRRAIERDDEQCVGCGLTRDEHLEMWGEDLPVHHKRPLTTFPFVDETYNRDWEAVNALSNLMTCCRTCHPDLDAISRSMYSEDEYPRYVRSTEPGAETPAEAVQTDLLEFA